MVKNPFANARDITDTGLIPGSGRCPGGLRRLRRLWAGPRIQRGRGRGRGRGWGPSRGCLLEEESSDGESDDEVRQSEASPALGGAEAGGFQGSGWPRGVMWGSGVLRAFGEGKGPGNRQGRR